MAFGKWFGCPADVWCSKSTPVRTGNRRFVAFAPAMQHGRAADATINNVRLRREGLIGELDRILCHSDKYFSGRDFYIANINSLG
jgi:hypothetical protein